MKKYNVEITNQAHESLDAIIEHKINYSDDLVSAYNFRSGFYEQGDTLSSFPHRGFNMPRGNKAQVYSNHLIIYQIIEPNEVRILDLIDPRQHTVAIKYY